MARKKKTQTVELEQKVVTSAVKGESFDMILKFTDSALQPELYMDELVKLILEGLIERYGEILVKVNWWADGLVVVAPNKLPEDTSADTPTTSQDGS